MVNGEVLNDPDQSGVIELANGGGVLLRDSAAPLVPERQVVRQRRLKQLPFEVAEREY